MKNIIFGIIVGLAIGGVVTWTVLKHAGPEAGEEKKEEKKAESLVQHGTNGETFLKLDQATQDHIGLKTAALESTLVKPVVKAYGHVLDPSPLAALVVERATAQNALEASTKEFERLKVLHGQDQNASTRALETAEAACKRDQVTLGAVNLKLPLNWGKALAGQPDLPKLVQALAAQEVALVRVEVPLTEPLPAPPTGGRLGALATPEDLLPAQYLGPAPSTDPQFQGQGFFFLAKDRVPTPGAALAALLEVPGDAKAGVLLPREAIIRHEGEAFVYLQTGAQTFVRKEIELDRPLEHGWFVTEGLKARDKVVVVGAQQLLSEELKGQGGGD